MDNSYSWEQLFTRSYSPFYGYVTSFSAAKEIVQQFENATNSSYVVRSVKHQGIGNESGELSFLIFSRFYGSKFFFYIKKQESLLKSPGLRSYL